MIDYRPVFLKEPVFPELIKAADLALIMIAALTAYLLYTPLTADILDGSGARYLIPSLAASLCFVYFLNHLGAYDLRRLKQARWQIPRLVGVWVLVISVFLMIAFFAKASETYSRLWTFSWTVLTLLLVVGQRGALCFILNSWAQKLFKRKVVVVGADEQLKRVITKLQNYSDEISIYGIFYIRPLPNLPQNHDFNLPQNHDFFVSDDIDDLLQFAQQVEIDHVILAVPLGADDQIKMLVERLKQLPLEVLISVELIGKTFPILSLQHIGDLPALEIVSRPIKPWGIIVKWIEDKLIGLLVLVLTSPLMLIIAALIKLDSPGPAFFMQERYGFNNRIIKVLKFRTMYVHAEDRSGARRTVENDSRVTRLGRVLRALSLDELPQILNVLKGEMSLVGPRPHAIGMKVGGSLYCDAVGEYAQRHRVKPGITGWAQINGLRGEVNSLERGYARVEHDLYYIERWSLLFDLKILAATIPAIISRRNAY